MTLLGMTFEQAAFSFGWGELVNFSGHLPTDSATYRAVNPNENKFSTGLQRNAILADICDAIRVFAFMFAKVHGGKGKKPKPYPRPWANDDAQKIGSSPIPISQFNEWYYGGE